MRRQSPPSHGDEQSAAVCGRIQSFDLNAERRSAIHSASFSIKSEAANGSYWPEADGRRWSNSRAMAATPRYASAVRLETCVNQSSQEFGWPHDRLGELLRDYAAAEIARAISYLGWRGGRLHTGVHQARKSIRRTRATLAFGIRRLGPGAALLDRELRTLNQGLSRLRDAHAVVGTLDSLIASGSEDAVPTLRRARRKAATARAERARLELVRDAQLGDRRALLRALLAALPALRWEALSQADIYAALQSSQDALTAAEIVVHSAQDQDAWHRWRRRARRLSQQHRALGDKNAELAAHEKRSKRFAVLLGEAQDYSLLDASCGKRWPMASADRRQVRAICARELARVRERVAKWLATDSTNKGDPAVTPAAALAGSA
jgi:hypothetical protein